MTSPQESRFTKTTVVISLVIAFLTLVIGFLTWRYPFAPRPETSAADTGTTTTTISEPPVQPSPESPPFESPVPSRAQPPTDPPALAKPARACDALETATLRPGAPAPVASGLAVLSVKTAREGSEPYLTLTIASDRGALAEAVLGAPARFHFKTSLGSYFVNVLEADLAAGDMTVQVGCEPEGNTP